MLEDLPIDLLCFLYIVRRALLNWWKCMAHFDYVYSEVSSGQFTIESRAAPAASDSRCEPHP